MALVAVVVVLLAAGAVFVSVVHSSGNPIASLFGGAEGTQTGAPGTQSAGASGAGSVPASQDSTTNGTVLATYTFDLPGQYSADLGVNEPTRAQLNPADGGDISYNSSVLSLMPGSNDQMVDLAGQRPSYEACAANTIIEGQAKAVAGSTFCIVEAGERIAGVTVNSIGTTETGDSFATLNVTVWQNSR